MTQALSAFGTLLRISTLGSPLNVVTIAEVMNHSLSRSRDTEEVTHQESTGQWKEFIALTHGAELTLELNFLPANTQHLLLQTIQDSGTLTNFQLVRPDEAGSTETLAFAAFVTQFNSNHPASAKLGASVTLQISGVMTRS